MPRSDAINNLAEDRVGTAAALACYAVTAAFEKHCMASLTLRSVRVTDFVFVRGEYFVQL